MKFEKSFLKYVDHLKSVKPFSYILFPKDGNKKVDTFLVLMDHADLRIFDYESEKSIVVKREHLSLLYDSLKKLYQEISSAGDIDER